MKKILSKGFSIILTLIILILSLSAGFCVSGLDVIVHRAGNKNYILGEMLYSNDFEKEKIGELPSGWQMSAAGKFGEGSNGIVTARVEEMGFSEKVLTLSSTDAKAWVSAPRILTRNYVFETTVIISPVCYSGNFGLANGMYDGIEFAPTVAYTSIPVKGEPNASGPYYQSQGTPGVERVDFKIPESAIPGREIELKLVALDGVNHFYFNDNYIGGFPQAESDRTLDWPGFYAFNGTVHISDVKITEIIETELQFDDVSIKAENNKVDFNLLFSFDRTNKLYSRNVIDGFIDKNVKQMEFGLLWAQRDSFNSERLTAESSGVKNKKLEAFKSDETRLYFEFSINSLKKNSLDEFYLFCPYILIGENYFYGETRAYSPARVANHIYSSSDDAVKSELKKAFASSDIFKGEDGKSITFALFSDLHYKENANISSVSDLKAILKRAEENSADFIMSGGDLSTDFAGSPEITNTYLSYKLADGSILPAYNVYGNNELSTDGNSMDNVTKLLTNDSSVVWGTSDGKFDSNIGYYYFEKNGFRIVCTDTNYSYNPDKKVWEHIKSGENSSPEGNINENSLGPDQLKWLEKVLFDAADKKMPCIIISHAGFYGKLNSFSGDSKAVRDIYAKVNEKRAGTVIMSVNGHYHTSNRSFKDGVFYFNTNSVRNGYFENSQEPHYTDGQTYIYEKYDDKGNLISSAERNISELPEAQNNWFFAEPLSAIVTVDEFGKVTVDGSQSTWAYDILPPATSSSVRPDIASGTFWNADSLSHIWSEEWAFDQIYHWHPCMNKSCKLNNFSICKDYGLHDLKKYISDDKLVEGIKSLYHQSCYCGVLSDKTFYIGNFLKKAVIYAIVIVVLAAAFIIFKRFLKRKKQEK